MDDIPVFAGLGSDSLFSEQSAALALADLQTLEARLILRDCFDIFTNEVRLALDQRLLTPSSINLSHFSSPTTLLQPPASYHRSVLISHATLYLTQVLRYVSYRSTNTLSRAIATSGFCVGILPAAALSTAPDLATFLLRARQFFHLALQLGIHCEASRCQLASSRDFKDSEPWSLVVDGIASRQAASVLKTLRHEAELSAGPDVFVSAINGERCVTISGYGDDLHQVVSKRLLPAGCRIRRLQIYSLYHNKIHLRATHSKIFGRLQQSPTLRGLDSSLEFACPLISPSDGRPYDPADLQNMSGLFTSLLDSILLDPVQWVEVEQTLLTHADKSRDMADPAIRLLNFGPGYGFSVGRARTSHSLDLIDVSAMGISRSKSTAKTTAPTGDDIAIVGMAVDLPDAPDAQNLWENLINGKNSCSEIPPSRFHIEDFQGVDADQGKAPARGLKTKYGNFIHNPFEFDNAFFNVSPREARSIDPQQRVMIQTAYRALEDSGYTPDATPSCSRETFGAFIGNATLDYPDNLKQDIDVYYSPGTLRAFQSGRISYAFGWSGPSVTLDTACSSSMVAMHQAARSIAAGDCKAALVGGVNVITSPDMYLGLDRAHFLSATGQCKAFDASADGYCRSEGCVAFVVKKLSDAIAENDKVLGVIRGIEINQSGNTHSITHPHAPTQAVLFDRLLSKTQTSPHHISLAELHGTGTQAGDPEELQSVRMALCKTRPASNTLHLTSIKANIGHCEAASGGASLAKVLLMMKHKLIPAQVSLKHLNPKIGQLGVDGAVIDTVNTSWDSDAPSRLALLNNFGAAGSNAALLVQEHLNEGHRSRSAQRDHQVTHHLGLSAKGEEALGLLRDELVGFLNTNDALPIEDICYTYSARRQTYDCRISVVGTSLSELSQALQEAPIARLKHSQSESATAVFAFSGQGSQFTGMGADLMDMYPKFSDTVEECESLLQALGMPGCIQVIKPTQEMSAEELKQPHIQQAFQSAVFAVEIAQARLLESWNVQPSAVLGHSLGEYAALTIAGVISLKDGLRLVARRAQLFMQDCKPFSTSMLAVNANRAQMQDLLAQNPEFAELEVCCNNSPTDCVIGGPVNELQRLKDHVKNKLHFKSTMLQVPVAYHTRAVDPILTKLARIAEGIDIHPPSIAVGSNVLGRIVKPGERAFDAAYFARHCREMVAFDESVQAMLAPDSDIDSSLWLELGPSASLIPMIKTRCRGSITTILPFSKKGVSSSKTLSAVLSHLYTNSSGINWRQVHNTSSHPQLIEVPVMPFIKKEFVVSYPREHRSSESSVHSAAPDLGSRFLSTIIQNSNEKNGNVAIYETPIVKLEELITGHIVVEHALCPASVYHEMALSAVRHSRKTKSESLAISTVSYHKPLLYREGSGLQIRVTIGPSAQSSHRIDFAISSQPSGGSSAPTVHCDGIIKIQDPRLTSTKHARAAPALQHRMAVFRRETSAQQSFFTRVMYEMVFPRVVTYSKIYQTVQYLSMNFDMSEALAQCKLPSESRLDASSSSSILMDTLLHVAGFVANFRANDGEAYICKEVKTAVVLQNLSELDDSFEVFCNTHEIPGEHSTVSDAYATNKNGILAVFKGMVFQQVKLAKVAQAFRLLSGKGLSAPTAPGGAKRQTPRSSADLPAVKETVLSKPKSQLLDVRKLLEDICRAERGSFDEQTTLESLGVDSLLSIELETQLYASLGTSPDRTGLAECETVGDIERLVAHTAGGRTPSVPPQPVPSAVQALPVAKSVDLAALISETCGAEPASVTSQSSLEALGVDSLMFLELEARLNSEPGVRQFSSSALAACVTVEDVQRLLTTAPADHILLKRDAYNARAEDDSDDSQGASSGETSVADLTGTHSSASSVSAFSEDAMPQDKAPSNIASLESLLPHLGEAECIQSSPKGSTSAPLMLIHDGSGLSWPYRRLHNQGRAVHALSDAKLLATHGWPSLSAMADHYASVIAQSFTASTRPPLLGGWSFGGVVAFEAARRLRTAGRPVAGVVLIDAPPPLNHTPLSAEIIDAVTRAAHRRSQGGAAAQQLQAATARNFGRCAALLGAFTPSPVQVSNAPHVVLLRSREGYQNAELQGPPNAWLQDRSDPRTAVEGWEVVVGDKVQVVDIPGNHFEVFDGANVAAVSARLQEACRSLDV